MNVQIAFMTKVQNSLLKKTEPTDDEMLTRQRLWIMTKGTVSLKVRTNITKSVKK